VGDEAALVLADLGAEPRAGVDEPALDPRRVFAGREPRVREFQLESDRLEPVAYEVDEEEQAEEQGVKREPGKEVVWFR